MMNNIIDDKVEDVIEIIKNMDLKKQIKTWSMYKFKCLY